MRKIINNKKNKGQAILASFIYVSIAALVGITMMGYAQRIDQIVIKEIAHTKAWYGVEAGLMRAITRHFGGNTFNGNMQVAVNSDGAVQYMTVQIQDVAGASPQIRQLRAITNNWWQ